MKGIGVARLIVIKHNPEKRYSFSNEVNSIIVAYADVQLHGFMCQKDWRNTVETGRGHVDVIKEEAEKIADYLQDKPVGFYEILAGFAYVERKVSYEYDEWESEWELLNPAIQPIKYEHLEKIADRHVLLEESICLLGIKLDSWLTDTSINYYMSKKEIKARQLLALTNMNDYMLKKSAYLCDLSGMTEKELDDAIHIAMLMYDSEGSEENQQEYKRKSYQKSLEIDKNVLYIEGVRSSMFDPEE